MDFLRHLFSFVCGQVNCWTAGSLTSAACQRCTGLYVGALIAAVLFGIFRPRPTSLSLWLHGLMMLAMAPFGYHLVAHGAIIRAVTGQVFGYGMMYYLLLVPADRFDLWNRFVPYPSRALSSGRGWGSCSYFFALLAALLIVVPAARSGSSLAIIILSWLAFVGLLKVVALVACNIFLLVTFAWSSLRGRSSVTP